MFLDFGANLSILFEPNSPWNSIHLGSRMQVVYILCYIWNGAKITYCAVQIVWEMKQVFSQPGQ